MELLVIPPLSLEFSRTNPAKFLDDLNTASLLEAPASPTVLAPVAIGFELKVTSLFIKWNPYPVDSCLVVVEVNL